MYLITVRLSKNYLEICLRRRDRQVRTGKADKQMFIQATNVRYLAPEQRFNGCSSAIPSFPN